MSSAESPTPVTTSASQTNLFPSSTRSSGPDNTTRSTNVYYLVFLGVLVILLLLAACLAFRAFRLRRRHRTAIQMALARGGPLPDDPRSEFWGLGGFPGWFPDGERIETADGRAGRKGKSRWQKIPILWENEVEEEDESASWGDNLPIMLASRRDHEVEEPIIATPTPVEEPAASRRRPLSALRFGRNRAAYPQPAAPAPPPQRRREIDREVEDDEDVRMAVVIRMPFEDGPEDRRAPESDAGSEEDEEKTGWLPGMELGVWDGHVGSASFRYR